MDINLRLALLESQAREALASPHQPRPVMVDPDLILQLVTAMREKLVRELLFGDNNLLPT